MPMPNITRRKKAFKKKFKCSVEKCKEFAVAILGADNKRYCREHGRKKRLEIFEARKDSKKKSGKKDGKV